MFLSGILLWKWMTQCFIKNNEEYYEAKLSTARNFFKMAGNVYFFTKMTDETGTDSKTPERPWPLAIRVTRRWVWSEYIYGVPEIPKKRIAMEMQDSQFLQKTKISKSNGSKVRFLLWKNLKSAEFLKSRWKLNF